MQPLHFRAPYKITATAVTAQGLVAAGIVVAYFWLLAGMAVAAPGILLLARSELQRRKQARSLADASFEYFTENNGQLAIYCTVYLNPKSRLYLWRRTISLFSSEAGERHRPGEDKFILSISESLPLASLEPRRPIHFNERLLVDQELLQSLSKSKGKLLIWISIEFSSDMEWKAMVDVSHLIQ
jgi:hypothetical protein